MAIQAFKNTVPNKWVDRTTNSWDNASVLGSLRNSIEQIYALSLDHRNELDQIFSLRLLNLINQPYYLATPYRNSLEALYGIKLMSILTQYYDDVPRLKAALKQWYWDASLHRRSLEQTYGDAKQVGAELQQEYILAELLKAVLNQEYLIASSTPLNTLSADYSIKNVYELIQDLKQSYTIYPESITLESESSVTINGFAVRTSSVSVEYSQSSYVGSCSLNLTDFGAWLLVDYQQPVVVTIDSQDYYFIVTSKSKSETVKNQTLSVECMSQAVLLDFPYAIEVADDDLITGDISSIVNNLAGLEGLSITWSIPVDYPITVNDVQVAGDSPLQSIKRIVNELGGIVQSHPDGSIHAVPRYSVDSDKYDTVTPTEIYTTGDDFLNLSDETDKRDGYNKYFISDVSSDDGYTLDSEEISSSKFELKAYKVPWSSQAVQLTTSELTNVIITINGLTTEELTEEIEIVEGAGNVDKPFYNLIDTDYKTSTNLGAVDIKEDGSVTTTTQGNTLVELTYTTKYWKWTATNVDEEDVQFILEVV